MATYRPIIATDTGSDPDALMKMTKVELIDLIRSQEQAYRQVKKGLEESQQEPAILRDRLASLHRLGRRYLNVIAGMAEYARCQSEATAETYETWEMMRVMLDNLEEQLSSCFDPEEKS